MMPPTLSLLLLLAAAPVREEPGQPEGVVKPPRLTAGTIGNDDYPPGAIRAGAEGTSQLDLVVSPAGHVTRCSIFESSGSPLLDHTSCGLIVERFRYAPARDRAGRSVEGRSRFRVVWRLPATEGPPLPLFAAGEIRVILSISPNAPPRCAVETTGPTFEAMAPLACLGGEPAPFAELQRERNVILTVTRFLPEGATLAEGRPVRGIAMGSIAADVEVASDGRITACRRVELGAVATPEGMPHPCDAPLESVPGFAPLDGAGPARGRLTVTVYRLGDPDI
jgi:TonB family protein